MPRKRHPNADIEDALRQVEKSGWRVELSAKGHAWGRINCS